MLKAACIHPEIMRVLSLCGHGDKILIADGNYPLASKSGGAKCVYLGLEKGSPTVTAVLEVICKTVNMERAEVMAPEGQQPPIFEEFRQALGSMKLDELSRYDFYDAASQPDVRLAISTGEQRTFANILLTINVV